MRERDREREREGGRERGGGGCGDGGVEDNKDVLSPSQKHLLLKRSELKWFSVSGRESLFKTHHVLHPFLAIELLKSSLT